jgi:hypothetical protein
MHLACTYNEGCISYGSEEYFLFCALDLIDMKHFLKSLVQSVRKFANLEF